jgi:pyruvate ferredoxin oxidoreductase beta subunit/phenylglyoxylate dehydrogenase beta subunit
MSMHDIPYVATASMSHLEDYARKLTKAKEKAKEGFVYLHVFCPCLVGWKIPMDASIQVSRAAVRTNYFTLWECENGEYRITQKVNNPKPIQEFTKLMGKFKHLNDDNLQTLQGMVDKRNRTIQALCNATARQAG